MTEPRFVEWRERERRREPGSGDEMAHLTLVVEHDDRRFFHQMVVSAELVDEATEDELDALFEKKALRSYERWCELTDRIEEERENDVER